jgi:hypothetical protein
MAKKQLEVITVSYAEYTDPDYHFPSRFVFRCALGFYNFIKTNRRSVAEQYVKEHYDSKYVIREV